MGETRPNSAFTPGSGYPTLVIDEAGKKRQTWTDSLGRVIEVDEPDASGNLTLSTCYAHDLLDNVTPITQGSQTRTYSYDALSRLTAATTPESGTTNFYYTKSSGGLCSGDPNAVCRRSDARSITTTYAYDALNRLTSKTYSDSTPAANFYYDEASVTVGGTAYTVTNAKGRLSHTSAGSGTAIMIWSLRRGGTHPRPVAMHTLQLLERLDLEHPLQLRRSRRYIQLDSIRGASR